MLTAELKLNGKVIGAIEIRRTYITGANGLPWYNAHTRVDNPRGAGILLHDHLVEDHDPDRDDAWDLVRKALSWKADAERADLEHQRDELRAEVARLQREVSEVRYDLGEPKPCAHAAYSSTRVTSQRAGRRSGGGRSDDV